MSLSSDKQAAKNQVKAILDDMLKREETSTEEFANRLIEAMEEWLKKATIIYTSGLTQITQLKFFEISLWGNPKFRRTIFCVFW